ncbi:MAG TPA: nucleotide exchange factor GrpE [Chloroflexota bacterium]|nr:nucleotide exchange factor GrpE [Chloroflexota bacterium]
MSEPNRTPGDETQPDATTRPDQPATGPSSASETELRQQLEDTRAKCQTYLDLAQRAQADFVNYKRRVEQERSDYARSARAESILKALPTLDDLERAVASLPASLAGSDWAQGIVLIERKLHAVIESEGAKPIEAVGKPFDPWQQEALAHEPSTQFPAGTVSRVYRTGYSLDGRVIRPAQVVVSSGPPDERGQAPAQQAGDESKQTGGAA